MEVLMIDVIAKVNGAVNSVVWGVFGIVLLFAVGAAVDQIKIAMTPYNCCLFMCTAHIFSGSASASRERKNS